MSNHPGQPEREPSAAELDRVRALLAGLGEEPAPPAVVERLERVLEAQLPVAGTAPAPRRRRRWVRGVVLGAVPVAAIALVAVLATQTGSNSNGDQEAAGGAADAALSQAAAAPEAAPESASVAAAPAPATDGEAADSAAAEPQADTAAAKASSELTAAATPEELRQAALDAYRETRRVLLDRRAP